MNPSPLVLAELRRNPWGCAAIVALIALAVVLGAMSTAVERALRLATLRILPTDARELAPVLGNMHDLAHALPFAFDGLLVTAVLLIVASHLSARRQSIGALRALGAPPVFLFAAVWLQGVLLIGLGVLAGLLAAIALAKGLGAIAGGAPSLEVDTAIGMSELAFAGTFFIAGSLFAAAPSLPILRIPVAQLLRSR